MKGKGEKMNDNYYITMQGWMVQKLGLKGNDLFVYALIYGFTQDGETLYKGSYRYISYALGISRKTAIRSLESLEERGLIIKSQENINGVLFNRYKIDFEPIRRFGCKETKNNLDEEVQGYGQKDHGGMVEMTTGVCPKRPQGYVQNDHGGMVKKTTSNNIRDKYIENTYKGNNTKENIYKRNSEGDKPPTPTKRTRFTPPTVEEVEDYCRERDNGIDAEHFIDYYEARGWELSKGRKVKDWKACVRTWERNNRSKPARKAGEGKTPEPKERLNLESIIRELPEESQEAVREYVTMRERTNHPIATENTLIRAIKKAKEFAGDDTGKFTRIFEQSTDHSWQGVYDLKEDNAAKENTERKSVNPKDYDFSTLEGYEAYIKATGFWG